MNTLDIVKTRMTLKGLMEHMNDIPHNMRTKSIVALRSQIQREFDRLNKIMVELNAKK